MKMKDDDTTVLNQLTALAQLSRPELIDRWRMLYGHEPPNSSKEFLRHRLAYRVQELFYGGMDEELKEKLKMEPLPGRKEQEGMLKDGMRLVRTWHDKEILVTVCGDKFEYDNHLYRSLSGIARKITGTNWNGYEFFGIKRARKCKQ